MKKPIFTGACTALVTPFLDDQVNYPMLERLLARQIDAGIESVVICGTTGESPTLSDEEKLELVRRAKAYAGQSCKIIAGTGSNATLHTIELSRKAEQAGADGLLVVTPYYNKANAEGLYRHYMAVARSVDIPVIVYNVPSRTGVDIPVSVLKQLDKIPNIAGIKEASSDITKITKIRRNCSMAVYTGNDDQITPVMSMGGAGVISVLSNLLPVQTKALCDAAWDGDFDTASALQIQLQPIIELLFADINPIPVKAAMKLIGFDCGTPRLPLTEAGDELLKKLESHLLQ